MALANTKVAGHKIIDAYRFTAEEFEWPTSGVTADVTLQQRVARWCQKASRRIQKRVGATTYASTVDQTSADLYEAEFALSSSYGLRERLQILSGRPEEAPPSEHIERSYIETEIERLEAEAEEILAPYATAEDFDRPGTGFEFGAKGVDETKADISDADYDEFDYGDLPS